ncbi:MAG: hypothetical protein AMJ62_10100 [Myxococcales bacterium SG8_38]|nr:MAG: hypothetical protein AMJ62_10100 [Myxococcales bacterium SG8_38]
MKRINRRAVLKGTIFGGTVVIGLPMLEAMLPAKGAAQANGAPKRIVFWFTANGTRQDLWSPPSNMDLGNHPLHAAMAPFSSKLIFLDGVDQSVAYDSIGDGHQTGMACLLTNAEILPGDLFCEGNCDAGNEKYVGWGGGQSVDQYLAGEIQKDVLTKFKSLELGVQVKSSSVWSRMSYAGPDTPVPPREDPNQNFVDLFSDLDTDPFALRAIQRRRRSILDAVMEDYDQLERRLGFDDKQRLEKHAQSIRDLERRLEVTTTFGEACTTPELELPGGSFEQNDVYPLTGRAQMDMLAMALACDLTRVASLQWSRSVSNVRFSWVPQVLNEGHHGLSHYDDSDPGAQSDLLEINKWYSEQFAYLLGLMDGVQEGDNTLLDNSVVVWVNELGKGNTHTRRDIPFVLAGGCQGYLRTGQHIDFGGEPHGKLLVSLTHAMGKPVDTFGVSQYSQGPLSGLAR